MYSKPSDLITSTMKSEPGRSSVSTSMLGGGATSAAMGMIAAVALCAAGIFAASAAAPALRGEGTAFASAAPFAAAEPAIAAAPAAAGFTASAAAPAAAPAALFRKFRRSTPFLFDLAIASSRRPDEGRRPERSAAESKDTASSLASSADSISFFGKGST